MRIDFSSLLSPEFFHELENVGAVSVPLIRAELAQIIGKSVEGYPFVKQPDKHGKRDVFQHFSACEEENVPPDSLARALSRCLNYSFHKAVSMNRTDFFRPKLELNNHLLLKFPPGDLGLGAHRDLSKYINLIISITLVGEAEFNIHDTESGKPAITFVCKPGVAVFMRAPGFMSEEVRPLHSVTAIGLERTSLILKQRKV